MEFNLLLIFASIFSIPYGIFSVIHSTAYQSPFLVHSFTIRGAPNNGNHKTSDGVLAFQKLGNKVLKSIQTHKKQNMKAKKIMITFPKMAMNGGPNDGKIDKKEPRIINEENKNKLENLFSMNGIDQIGYDQTGKMTVKEECPFETDEPLIVICGATGTGKSELAIEIAKRIGGEVISADSMQIYKGLDIATNKVTEIEMNGVPHHLMSFVEPMVPNYDQWQFRNDAIKIIKQIWKRQVIPIVTGGSASYIESLIYCKEEPKIPAKKIELHRLLEMFPTGKALYEKLMEVDPETANQILPDNTAKVIRELEFYYSEEMKTESRLKMEAENAGDGKTKNELKFRYKNTLLIYLDTKMRAELKNKLDNRVEKMIKKGLINELEEYYEKYKNFIGDVNQAWFGGMQTIGLNAFLPYLEMNEQEKMSENGKNIFETCKIEFQKQDNEYAKLQRKNFYEMIFQPAKSHKQALNVIGLNMSNGFQKILPFSTELVQTFIDGKNFKKIVEMNPKLILEIVKLEEEMPRLKQEQGEEIYELLGVEIYAGHFDLSDQSMQKIEEKPINVIIHENSTTNSSNINNIDVALIKISEPLNFSENMTSICLTNIELKTETIVRIAGWGDKEELDTKRIYRYNIEDNNILQESEAKIIDSEECLPLAIESIKDQYKEMPEEILQEIEKIEKERNKFRYCLQGMDNSTTQKGDNGGPMMHFINGTWFTFGIASEMFIRESLEEVPKPIYYVKIDEQLCEWIQINTEGNVHCSGL